MEYSTATDSVNICRDTLNQKTSILLLFVSRVGGMSLSGRSCNVMPHCLRLEMKTKPASKKHPLFLSACPDHCQMLEEEVM